MSPYYCVVHNPTVINRMAQKSTVPNRFSFQVHSILFIIDEQVSFPDFKLQFEILFLVFLNSNSNSKWQKVNITVAYFHPSTPLPLIVITRITSTGLETGFKPQVGPPRIAA